MNTLNYGTPCVVNGKLAWEDIKRIFACPACFHAVGVPMIFSGSGPVLTCCCTETIVDMVEVESVEQFQKIVDAQIKNNTE